jgi:AraC-like DNA-binding protein
MDKKKVEKMSIKKQLLEIIESEELDGIKLKDIALRFGCSESYIYKILKNKGLLMIYNEIEFGIDIDELMFRVIEEKEDIYDYIEEFEEY